jgi:hypothetical protein
MDPMEIEQFGTKMDDRACRHIYAGIASILQIRASTSEFIGSHPVSLCTSNIHFLLDSDYLVCEKADGIRVMLLAHEKILYFYDRKNLFYRTRYAIASADTFLFDGELYQEGEACIFAIFDSLISTGTGLVCLGLLSRLESALAFTRAPLPREQVAASEVQDYDKADVQKPRLPSGAGHHSQPEE